MTPTFGCAFNEETRTITVTGVVDVAAAVELRRYVIAHADDFGQMTMDLTKVESLSGGAVGVIASARAEMRAHAHHLKLVAAQGTVASEILPDNGMTVLEA